MDVRAIVSIENKNLWGVVKTEKHAWGKNTFYAVFFIPKRKSSNVRHLETLPL